MSSNTVISNCKESLKERMRHIFKNKIYSDCQFDVQTESSTKTFQVHKLTMATASPVFEAMFYDVMAENKPVVINDIKPEVFEAMLEYIYTEDINLPSSDQYCELFYAAKKYMLSSLQKKCVHLIQSNIRMHNACKGYEFAKIHEESSLMKYCLKTIQKHATEVLTEANLKDVEPSTISTILDQDFLNIESETTLFNVIEIYANKIIEKGEISSTILTEHQPFFREALKKIRFLTMTPREFAEGLALSSLITKSEKFAIIMNISSPVSAFPMPQEFSTSRATRNHKKTGSYNRVYIP